jgi:hypothetical protein
MNLLHALGLSPNGSTNRLTREVKLHLAANGLAPTNGQLSDELSDVQGILAQYRERVRLLSDHRCPADQRIEAFLASYFKDSPPARPLRLPGQTLALHRHGLARELSLPESGNEFSSGLLSSFRLGNGVLHNPRSDRRTTQGTFHIAEGGLPIPGDKRAVPKEVFAEMFRQAVNPPPIRSCCRLRQSMRSRRGRLCRC